MNTWLLSLFAASIGYYNGIMTLPVLGFFLSFTSMQFIEYLLWSFPKWNSEVSLAGYGVIVLQPFFSILQANDTIHFTKLLGGYGVFLLYSLYILLNQKEFGISMKSIVAPNGHLEWKWLPSLDIVFTFLYFILLFTPLIVKGYSLSLIGGLITLFISVITYYKDNTWGSMWCWFAALFSFGVIGESIMKAGVCKK